jgi:hypothetical protein
VRHFVLFRRAVPLFGFKQGYSWLNDTYMADTGAVDALGACDLYSPRISPVSTDPMTTSVI